MTELKSLRVERRSAGVALVEIDRPAKLNAMDRTFFGELVAVLDEFDRDPELAVCVLTASGRAFSVGADLNDFARLSGAEDFRLQVKLALGAFGAVEAADTVVIAAVNGMAFAGGTELALAADIALAAESASFSFREITIGLMPSFGVVRGPAAIGRGQTSLLALGGGTIDAAEALRIGLVQRLCAPERLREEALGLAAEIAARPRTALRTAKRFINRGAGAGIAESIEATARLFGTEEHERLVSTFLASRRTASPGDAME